MSRRDPRAFAAVRPGPRPGRPGHPFWIPLLVLGLLAPSGIARAGDLDPIPLAWRRDPAAGVAGAVVAVAVGAADDGQPRLAVADADGLFVGSPSRPPLRTLRLPGVSDLCFDRRGVLWAATLNGLWSITREAAPVDRSPGAGELTRAVRRVAWSSRFGLVGSDSGGFATLDGTRWVRLPGPLSSQPVRAIAFTTVSDPPHRGAVTAGAAVAAETDLWHVDLEAAAEGLRLQAYRLDPPPGGPLGAPPVDLAGDWPGFDLVVLYPRDLALHRLGDRPTDWRVIALGLPPGANARRLYRAAGWLWIAHDRGLARARRADGSWERASSPAGRLPTFALAAADGELYAATESGLLVARASPAPAARGAAAVRVPRDPDIRAVQDAAIRYLDLAPARWRSRFRGLAHRGWLPRLVLDFELNDDRDHGRDDDQSFVSGDTRFLVDRNDKHGREYSGSVSLVWDLPSLAYDDSWDDLSREVRQLIALRDDVLDEVNQLYFERRRVLDDLAARPPDDAESARLRLRADELAAGIDAWTGGWFLARVRAATPEASTRPAEEKP